MFSFFGFCFYFLKLSAGSGLSEHGQSKKISLYNIFSTVMYRKYKPNADCCLKLVSTSDIFRAKRQFSFVLEKSAVTNMQELIR